MKIINNQLKTIIMTDENGSVFKCPKCGKTTGGNEKFCIDCGQALDVICPECGEKWRFMFDYKFCPACGHNMKNVDDKIQV